MMVPLALIDFGYSTKKILLPINKNLQPLLPNEKEKKNLTSFSVYNKNCVYIKSIEPVCTLMSSKERPKKLKFIGSDGKTYSFLLKYDKTSDMRKESRFIDFANYVNVVFENEPETRKRDLNLKTYAINPLSCHTGLIEWIDNTLTIKNVIHNYWMKQGIKVDIASISRLCSGTSRVPAQKVDKHWKKVNETSRDVLFTYFSDRF